MCPMACPELVEGSRISCETWGLRVLSLIRLSFPHPPIVLLASDFSTLVLTPLIDL